MTCRQEPAELVLHVLTTAESGGSGAVADHLRSCPVCAGEAARLRSLVALLRSVPREAIVGDWDELLSALREAAVRSFVGPH